MFFLLPNFSGLNKRQIHVFINVLHAAFVRGIADWAWHSFLGASGSNVQIIKLTPWSRSVAKEHPPLPPSCRFISYWKVSFPLLLFFVWRLEGKICDCSFNGMHLVYFKKHMSVVGYYTLFWICLQKHPERCIKWLAG